MKFSYREILLPITLVSQENLILEHCKLTNGLLFSGAGISKLDSMTAAQGVCEDITKILSRVCALHVMYTVTNITQ